ncbi:MAG: peptide MFS transporter [Candidatus Aminicenantes bacterium]|nr:peptide MFS transporter [Candidatus Aminicenantes bacterium]
MMKNHPKSLWVIFMTEIWERVGFYTLMAVLVLYMDKTLGWSDSRKGTTYGLFLALCYFIPLLGGWLGDRVFGRRATVLTGSLMMAAGYVGLAVSSASRVIPFYAGLFLIGFGTGIFKVNMSVMVGNLYEGKSELKDAGFNIFYMAVNIGAAVAPLIATFVGVTWNNYNINFWVCAAGLVVGAAIFRAGWKRLASADLRSEGKAAVVSTSAVPISAAETRQRIATLITLFVIVILFWVAFYQDFFGLTLFAERSTRIYKFLRPETYQFFEPFYIVVLTPLMLALFARMRTRDKEPSTPVKIFLGMLFMGLAMLVMVFASLAGGDKDANNMSPAWLIGTYFIVTIAEILISPMGQSYVSKVAPPRIAGLMMGGWMAAIAFGSYGSGWLGRYYSDFAHHQFFLLLTGLLVLSAVLVLIFLKRLKRFAS